jgi:teichuronic acid biosynthesis glycosyltransferase TuaC
MENQQEVNVGHNTGHSGKQFKPMIDRMRILTLSTVFPNPKDPLFGIFVKERIKRVAEHCEVVVVAPVPWFPLNRLFRGAKRSAVLRYEIQDGISVYHPKFFSVPGVYKSLDGFFYFLSVFLLVCRLRQESPFDLIDAHFVYPDGVAASLLAKYFGCPITITLRGTIGKLSKFLLRRKQIQWALRVATRVISVSRSLQEIAVGLGCDPQKMRVIPNGIDGSVFHPLNKTEARQRLGLPLNRTILLSVGALCERKGHHRVVEILPQVIAQQPDLLFVVVGGPGVEGDTGPLLKRLSVDLGIEKHFQLAGPRPHDEIAYWLAAADVFCLATSNEGMANVLIEALACGVPVVTTRVGGNAELVECRKNGFLVNLGDSGALQNALLEAVQREWDRVSIARAMAGRTWAAAASQVVQEWQVSSGFASREIKSQHLSASV